MFGLNKVVIDKLSFWLGFIAASLLWLIILRLRREWPGIRDTIKAAARNNRERRLAGVGVALRQEVLQRAQRNHISANLFSLDEILTPPMVMATHPYLDPEEPVSYERYSTLILGYQPEIPEFNSIYGSPRLSLPDVLREGARIALIGRAGAGKTTALAYLASQIARKDPSMGPLANLSPLYIHALDIDIRAEEVPPLERIISAQAHYLGGSGAKQLARYIDSAMENNAVILLLDGLDELVPSTLGSYTALLKALIDKHPTLRMVVTGSTDNLDKLVEAGFEPAPLSGWTSQEIRDYLQRWGRLWNEAFSETIGRLTNLETLGQSLVTGWLGYDPLFMTPLEWTLKVWGAMAGDLPGPTALDAYQAYFDRVTGQQVPDAALGALANAFLQRDAATLAYTEAENILSDYKIDSAGQASEDPSDKGPYNRRNNGHNKAAASGSQIVNLLIENRILAAWPDGNLSFANPAWNGFLAAISPVEIPEPHPDDVMWPARYEFYHFCFGMHAPGWLEEYVQTDSAPIYRNLTNCMIWLRGAQSNHPNRSFVMRHILFHLQNNRAPLGVRLKLLAACSTSNDPALVLLFRQFLSNRSADVRYLGILGCGINQDAHAIREIGDLIADEDPLVRQAACFALANIDHPDARQTVTGVVELGEETLRMTIAETMSSDPFYGHERLKEMVHSNDLLIRRAAVYGLSFIRTSWSIELLEKIAIEDGQWVVRNAASQALENFTNPDPYIPRPILHPADTGWLIAFAAKLGIGISKIETPVPALMHVLNSGTMDEQLSALLYIRNYPGDEVFLQLYDMAFAGTKYVSQAALYILWVMSISKAKLPNQIKFAA